MFLLNSLRAGLRLSLRQRRGSSPAERLEGRALLSRSAESLPTLLPTLVVDGDDNANTIVVSQSPTDPLRGVITVDGATAGEFDATNFLQINGLRGNDQLIVDIPRSLLATTGAD